ncbi:hypothetical protein [Acinetobacter guillouiae]|uniref:hypothetical protein n=1 Tax=Acinetobacter guillouiae TaxID=106649 RepID=UPI001CD3DAA2|nr:hypothetical protein [Acinetobacter guillouiae]
MRKETAIHKAHLEVKDTRYYSETNNLKTIIGIFHCLEDKFDRAKVNQITHIIGEGKAYLHLANGAISEINCSNAPKYEIQESVINWVKEQLTICEEKHSLQLFKELPINKVKGKLI